MIEIKQATLADIDPLSELFDQYRVFYRKLSDVEGSKAFLSERISKNESIVYIAIDEHGTPCGFTQLYPQFSSTRMQRQWLLNDLFVSPNHRGKGVSKLLLDRAKKLCRDTKACELMLETEKDNIIANKLYESTEFKKDELHNFYYWS